jgi:hypothetical protein
LFLVEVILSADHFQNGWKSNNHFQRLASVCADAVASEDPDRPIVMMVAGFLLRCAEFISWKNQASFHETNWFPLFRECF